MHHIKTSRQSSLLCGRFDPWHTDHQSLVPSPVARIGPLLSPNGVILRSDRHREPIEGVSGHSHEEGCLKSPGASEIASEGARAPHAGVQASWKHTSAVHGLYAIFADYSAVVREWFVLFGWAEKWTSAVTIQHSRSFDFLKTFFFESHVTCEVQWAINHAMEESIDEEGN